MSNIIDSLCMTWRHDYGLQKAHEDDSLSSGMTTAERDALRRRMNQIHAHHIAPLEERIRETERDRDAYAKHAKLLEHKVITCGVAARHPDANLSRTGMYAGKWSSPQAQDVRRLRDERDSLRRELESASQPGSGEVAKRDRANAWVREFEEWVKQTGALPWNGSWMAEVSSIIERAANGHDVKRAATGNGEEVA